MSDICANCKEELGFEEGWDEPPEGEGAIKAMWNPAGEPSYVVEQSALYCSTECFMADIENTPFDAPDAADARDEEGEV